VKGRIRDEAIQQVRERASLTEVVSDVVTLRRSGSSHVGLCPFHAEKTPSFRVSEERGFFYCFGCGAKGDVFSFVMHAESLTFPEAVRRVAQRFGVPLPEEVEDDAPRRDPLAAVNAAAAAFYRAELMGPNGARARAYLCERGLGDEVVEHFGLGWAPPGGEALVRHLRAKGVATEHALTLGLVLRRDRGGLYDRFRERIMFPIVDGTGKVIGFGGRVLPGRPVSGDPPPKYLNSPESPLFHKGQSLYGLAQARDAIRRTGRVIVVEGYVDVIALTQAGIAEVVAPLGTAVTADQLRLLRRFTEVVIACFDGDPAGRRAAARSFPTFLEAGLWGRGVFLPAAEDPDTFVRSKGRPALEEELTKAEPLVEAFLTERAGPQREAIGRRAEAAREVARILKRVRSPLEFDVLVRLAAERLGVREEALRAEGAPTPAAAPPVTRDRAPGAEELLVELMAADGEIANRVRDENVLADFEHPVWRRAGEAILAAAPEGDRTALLETLPRDLQGRVVKRLLGEIAEEDRERVLADCIARVRARPRRQLIAHLKEEIRAAQSRGDIAAADAATRRLNSLLGTATHAEERHR
jgi:DNA primase